MTTSISEKIKNYKNGNQAALADLIKQMEPLVIKYAKITFPLEFEDARQEYYLVIIQAVEKMTTFNLDAQCLKYLALSVKNRYISICKKYYSTPSNTSYQDELFYDDLHIENIILQNDIDAYFKLVKDKNNKKRKILYYFLFEGFSDIEIAKELDLSRQYIHKTKVELCHALLSKKERS